MSVLSVETAPVASRVSTRPDAGRPSRCPVCDGTGATVRYRFAPARWIPGLVVECRDCGLLYKRPLPEARPIADYYDEAYAQDAYWQREATARDALAPVLAAVRRAVAGRPARLLDVGCADGTWLALATESGLEASGLELNPALAARASARTGRPVMTGSLESAALPAGHFDVVTMLDLVEHLEAPVAALRACRSALRPGGCLVLYTPNHSGAIVRTARWLHRLSGGWLEGPVREIFDCLHLVFFDARTLGLALQRAGFRTLQLQYLRYVPERSGQARGLTALVLRVLEWLAPLAGGRFRLLVVARP